MTIATRTVKSPDVTDVRNLPAYLVTEAARYLHLPYATLRTWVMGSASHQVDVRRRAPVIHPARRTPLTLSFWNLIEAHVLRALRTDHGVSLPAVRTAIRYAEKELGIERLLLSPELKTDAGQLFLDRYGQLTDLTASGQLAMRKLFESHLRRVEWDTWRFPVRLYPFVLDDVADAARAVSIDAAIAFGRPVIKRLGVSTRVIAERIDAGESVTHVAADYALSESEVDAAVLCERAS